MATRRLFKVDFWRVCVCISLFFDLFCFVLQMNEFHSFIQIGHRSEPIQNTRYSCARWRIICVPT